MTKRKAADQPTPDGLSEQELEETHGEPLPDRRAMSLIRGVEPLPSSVIPEPPPDWE